MPGHWEDNMEGPHDELLAQWEELSRSVDDLRRRVALLERGTVAETTKLELRSQSPQADVPAPALPEEGPQEANVEWATSFVPLFGWGLLGIAGAYLLRALTELGYLPGILGVAFGIVY